MHKTFSPPAGTEFPGTGYPITRANVAICYPYGVPGGETAAQVLEKLRGKKGHFPERYFRRIARILPELKGA